MTVWNRRLLASLLVTWGVLTGCGPGSPGQEESFLDSMLSALTATGTPDLWVSSVSGPPSAPTSGSGFVVTVTACNQGAGSTSSTVSLYLSTDTGITPADTLVGSAPTGTLHPSQCATLQVQTSGPSTLTSGQRYVGAIIDPANTVSELSETNNTRSGTRMAFGLKPDLNLSQVSAPDSLLPSQTFEPLVTVCNTGTAATSGTLYVDIYLSSDSAITTADTRVGGASAASLAAGQCSTLVAFWTEAAVAPGQWYVGAIVDSTNSVAELVETNNTLVGNRLIVASGPDFTVSEVSGPATFSTASPLTLTATVCNQGRAAASSQVELYLSEDTSLTPEDPLVGAALINNLGPGRCVPVSVSGLVEVNNRQWYVGAWVDRANAVAEALEDNNTRI
ncbi:CARDB domain-containing protein, partial [Hyalangium sp.]|uniref:CARDB domain-containing protein n=1 Tax=Hyalangium sp. TaxID=2028555 RepID=UPI002D3F23C0